ncbi:MAG: alanine--tRNA ligase [Desulfurococcales archaeon]|nr:alanine--tRNA ligase [Desulfurococcales archaeon]
MTKELADPSEYALDFFKEAGFKRKIGKQCKEAFWTLNDNFDEPQDAPCVEYWFDKIPSLGELSVSEARESFLGFFEKHGHTRIKPRPVVARWREDLYLTIASIVVFQPHVTSGLVPPPANPLAISQPSIRLEDIDNVGLTIGRHLTVFEMAAHHAFNYPDKYVYWKDETVRLSFEFFTKELGIPPEMIVFKESWWEGGGNAGPSFEVVVGGIELATLVFMKYKIVDGRYEEIPLKIVDTGYGVERLAWFTRKTPTAFHAIYGNLLDKFRSILGVEQPDEEILWAAFRNAGRLDPDDEKSINDYYNRIAASIDAPVNLVKETLMRETRLYSVLDHTKTIALMLADGIVPSNAGEGYLARLVIRRALRQLQLLRTESKLTDLVDLQIGYWSKDFPQMAESRDYILDAVGLEEERFKSIVEKGRSIIKREIRRKKRITLDDLLRLYDSHGIPPEIVAEEARKFNIEVKVPHNFYSLVAARHKQAEGIGKSKRGVSEDLLELVKGLQPTEPLFHKDPYAVDFTGKVLAARGRYLILDRTLFYPTGGGQIHDTGVIMIRGQTYRVLDVISVNDVIVHVLDREANVEYGETVHGRIDWARRYRIMRHHSVTHVLIGAARRVLGRHVWQAGAEKTEEKGRLDLTHHRPLTRDDIEKLENEVNRIIDERRKITARIEPKNEAEEKYGFVIYQGGVPMKSNIRIVEVDGWDVEACYGTHVRNTGEIGGFKIINYSKIQDGIVRLEYVAGTRLAEEARNLENTIASIRELVNAGKGSEVARIKSVIDEMRKEREYLRQYRRLWENILEEKLASDTSKVRVLAADVIEDDRKAIQDVMKKLTDKYPTSIIALVSRSTNSTRVEIAVGRDAGVDAGEIARYIVKKLGGRGGGRGGRGSVSINKSIDTEVIEGVIRDAVKEIKEANRL